MHIDINKQAIYNFKTHFKKVQGTSIVFDQVCLISSHSMNISIF